MRLRIVAVGRLRRSPEAALVEDYLDRFGKTGRAVGLGPAEVFEVEHRGGGGRAAEAKLLLRALPDTARTIALDERGDLMTSAQFASLIAGWRVDGIRDAAILIGGAGGLDPELCARADRVLSFGPMVWPHALARVMAAEQLYRASTILAGLPYHKS